MTQSNDRLDRIEAALERMAHYQEIESREWRDRFDRENAEWKESRETKSASPAEFPPAKQAKISKSFLP